MEELLVSKYPDESGISGTCALLILRGEATAGRDDQKKNQRADHFSSL